MPTCKYCGRYGASADFRRAPAVANTTQTWVCKDKARCKKEKRTQ